MKLKKNKKMTTITGYKFIQKNMKSKNGNHKWKLGKWYKYSKKLKVCEEGFHACLKPLQSLDYVYGDKWFIVEARGKIIQANDKFVSSEMRLVKELNINKIVKPFAIWCAKQCLKNFEKNYPNDKRPAEAIKAAEDYLDKKITVEELKIKINAAESAESAAKSAAESAAWSAWSAAKSAESAWSAAWSAWSAAKSAKSAAESAAESAVESAVESAAKSAKSAAKSAAESAVESAQNKELLRLIKLSLKEK